MHRCPYLKCLGSITDVRELYKRFQNQVYGFALVEAQFESIIAFKPEVAQHVPLELLFDILDNDNDGRVDGLELLGGLTLCCHATFEEKARFCFELFDFNLNSIMSKNELVMMMMSSICGMNLLTGGGEELEPELEVFEALAADALARADLNSDGQIDYQEFLYWARSNRDLMTGLEALNRIAMEAIADIDPEDSAPETDDGDLSDTDPNNKVKSILQGEGVVQKSQKQIGSEISAMFNAPSAGDQGAADASNITPWKTQVFEPTNFKKKRDTNEGPATNLELSWAFGYKALNCRNNVRYVGSPDGEQHIVYFTAALGILYNPRTRTQSFYMGHTDAITCLSLHPNNQIVATADVKAHIHIWNVETPSAGSVAITALSVIKGFVKEGLLHVLFSPGGDRIVTVGRDNDHTICIHDVNSGQIISSAKGLVNPNFVFDIAFNAAGTELAVVGKQEIRFYTGVHTKKRAIDSYSGKIGKNGKRQTFFSVVYIREDAIVGCASGELYRFHEKHCVEIVQAHGLREPVLCLFYNSNDGTLFSGGKDCIIKMWDSSLRSVGEQIDLSEDVDGDGKADSGSLDSALISIQNYENVMLVGTRGSDIFQVTLPKRPGTPHAMERIAWGHATGDVWGLAVHPIREEFATCEDDKTLRIWSIRTHEQVNLRQMPEVSRSLAYSPNGEILCLGMADGSMALMEVNSPILRVYATWKHSEIIITDIKFSPNGNFIAAGSGDSNIYVYASDDKVEFRRHAVCRGHCASITHLDFSANSAHIQSNGADNALLFWNLQGNQVKNSSSLRDTAWATYTCTFGWPMQGIWPPDCEYEDINACQALPDIGDIVTGDDFHKVNLFKYPALKSGALHKTYVGHSSHVTCVRFSASKRYVVSVGGNDRTILLWKHSIELDESDIDDADDADGSSGNSSDSSGAASSSSGEGAGLPTAHGIYIANEIADVGPRSIEQEAVNIGWSVQDLQEYVQQHKSMVFANKSKAGANVSGAAAEPVAQWKSAIVEPSRWKREDGSTDVDLTLKWVHGFRAHDCRNSVLYSAAGDIVYNAAALAVVYNKGAGKQQYLMAAHVDEVIGLCRHPAGQIFASGEAGSQPSIVIWNSKDMQVQSKISKVHQRGVPLLAFNSKGNVLASIGLDADNTLCLHEWMKAVEILRTPTEKSRILALCFLANDSTSAQSDYEGTITTTAFTGNAGERPGTDIVVTAGVKHLKFWWAQGRNVQSQRALWGSSRVCRKEKEGTVMCVASTNKHICVTGSDTGSLIVWKNFKVIHTPMIDFHLQLLFSLLFKTY